MADNDKTNISSDEKYLNELLNSVVNSEDENGFQEEADNQLNTIFDEEADGGQGGLNDFFADADGLQDELNDLLAGTGGDANGLDDLLAGTGDGQEDLDTLFADEIPDEIIEKQLESISVPDDELDTLSASDDELDKIINSIAGIYDEDELFDGKQNEAEAQGEKAEEEELQSKEENEEEKKLPEGEPVEKTEKKRGIFSKLFHKEKKEKPEESENERIIREVEMGEFDELDLELAGLEDRSAEKKAKKGKGKKKKKEKANKGGAEEELSEESPKKGKEKKEKKKKVKAAKGKKPKEKKEKPLLTRDDFVQIPIPGYLLIVTFVAAIGMILLFGGSAYHYNSKMDSAVQAFVNKDYDAAYEKLAGMDIKGSDEAFYHQVMTVMYVQKQYTSYDIYRKSGDYARALNALVRGLERYDSYKEEAKRLGVLEDLNLISGKIAEKLQYDYQLSEEDARELAKMDEVEAYSRKIDSVVKDSLNRIENNIEKEKQAEEGTKASEEK